MKDISKKIFWALLGKTEASQLNYYYRNKWRLEQWEDLNHMFIHIPKNAGTSICEALDLVDPGHYTYSQLEKMGLLENKTLIYCVVREPLSRIVSTYNYIKMMQENVGYNPLSWVTKYETLNDFVLSGLNEDNASNNYFLCKQSKYLPNKYDPRLEILNLDSIKTDIKRLEGLLDAEIDLPISRKSVKYDTYLSKKAIKKIKKLYQDDFALIAQNKEKNVSV